ncbi:hypothetical protein CJF31_00002507 [Rutstroemia sp. NJR-2017a BVV2]|nr:hypothetical protein CJF31_00002507 [Rutstroemia sp. NJR-2017a BVV2]
MLSARALPPPFLLPSWTARQLAAVFTQQRRTVYRTPSHGRSKSNHKNKNKGVEGLFGPRKEEYKVPRAAAPKSLFEELFPEERVEVKSEDKPTPKKRKQLDKLPTFQWQEDTLSQSPGGLREQQQRELKREQAQWGMSVEPLHLSPATLERIRQLEEQERREASVLVLGSASKTLEESDFFRLSPKGQHIEGWTSGIIKIIPGRDPQTLTPLGHYFILFTSYAAARAYFDQIIRLHTLARTHPVSKAAIVPPPPGYLKPGEDVESLVRGFSLVPAYSRLSLRQLNKPYQPAILKLLSNGGPTIIARQKSGAEDMVLFSLEGGPALTELDVLKLLEDDGRRRNLLWRLAKEGKVVKLKDKNENNELGSDGTRPLRLLNVMSRYVVSFADRYEARRFVREWHRRPCPLQKEYKLGDEPPPIVSAKIMW